MSVQPITSVPFFLTYLSCGFPSPAEGWAEHILNLHDYLIQKPAATFFVRVEGDSMVGVGIYKGDLLIVDRSIEARHGSIIVAVVDGDFTLKRLVRRGGDIYLHAENPKYKDLRITPEMTFEIWGVAIHTVHDLRRV